MSRKGSHGVRAICLALVFVLVFLAGCSGKNAESTPSASEAASTGAAPSESASSAPESSAPPEPATLTFGSYSVPKDTMDQFDQTAVGKVIKEKLNITLKIRGSQNTEQELIADMAAGNLPDIFAMGLITTVPQNTELMLKAANEGALADLTDLIAQSPNLSKLINPERMPMFAQSIIFNPDFQGKLYYVPTNYSTQAPTLNGFGLYLRGDIAKSLNVDTTAIKTPDDLYNLAKQIKDGGFKDVNGKAVYPIGLIAPWSENLYALFRPFDYGRTGFTVENGKLVSFVDSEQIWQQIQFVRKLLAEDLIDPEAFSHSYQIGSEKVSQGRNAIMPFYASAVVPGFQAVMNALTSTHPEMEYVALSPMNDFRGSSEQILNKGTESAYILGVSKNANAEAAVRLLEWATTKEGAATLLYGEQDQQWFFNDKGYAQMKDDAYQQISTDLKGYQAQYGANILDFLARVPGYSDPEFDIFGGNTRNIFYQNNPAILDKTLAYIGKVMPNVVVKNQFDLTELMKTFPGKDKLTPALQQLNDILVRCYLTKNEAEAQKVLDDYRNTLNKSGFQEYKSYLQAEYDKDPNKYLVDSATY